MKDPLTGAASKLGRIKGAHVGGVYHPLVNEKLLRNFQRYETWYLICMFNSHLSPSSTLLCGMFYTFGLLWVFVAILFCSSE